MGECLAEKEERGIVSIVWPVLSRRAGHLTSERQLVTGLMSKKGTAMRSQEDECSVVYMSYFITSECMHA